MSPRRIVPLRPTMPEWRRAAVLARQATELPRIRKEHGLTQTELAALLDCSLSFVFLAERPDKPVGRTLLRAAFGDHEAARIANEMLAALYPHAPSERV